MRHCLVFLDTIEKSAPEFGGGGVELAKVICYYVLPSAMGGSKAKGDYYMDQAVRNGQGWILPRWARGKYYYPVRGEDEKGRQDLEWVASRNIDEYKDPLPWKLHFKQNAIDLLQ